MYTIRPASWWRRCEGSVAEVRNQDHDDREWQAIVEQLRAEPAPRRREPLVMRILYRTSHAAVLTIPALGTADHGAP